MAASRNTPLHVIALLALIIGVWISGTLCYRVAATDSFWLDELHTVWTVQQPDEQSFTTAAASGNQSTFYFRILQKLSAMTGVNTGSPLGLRSFSIVCSVLTVISLGFFVWYWTGSLYGSVLSVWAAGIDPRFVFYGSEARPYALLMLLAVWQFFVFCRLAIKRPEPSGAETETAHVDSTRNENSNRWAAVLLLLSIALALTHQTGLLLLAAEFLILLVLGKRSRAHWILLVTVVVVACLAVVGWQTSTYSDVFQRRTQWSTLSSVGGLVKDFRNGLVLLYVVPFVVLFVCWEKGSFRSRPHSLTRLLVVGAAGLLPPIFAGASDYLGWAPLGLYRYTLPGAILMPLFAGMAVSCIQREWLQMVLALTIVYAGIACPVPEPSVDGNSNIFVAANPFFIAAMDRLDDDSATQEFRMRYESWPRAVAAIKGLEDQRPIFLFANLLEDAQLAEFENGDESTEPDSDLIDYLRFPLSAFSLSPTRVIPRPTLSGNAFQPVNIRQIRDANGCWVLTRSDASTFERIASELNQKLTRSKNPEFEFEIQTQFVRLNNKDDARIPEWLSLFRVDLVPAN